MPIITMALVADLHFGTVPDGLAQALADDLNEQDLDLVCVGGDLTMKARASEYDAAARWIEALRPPVIVIPGNHDISARNPYERFTDPFRRFLAATRQWPVPNFMVDDCVIVGLNTVASWQPHRRWQEGVVRAADLAAAETLLKTAPRTAFKAVLAHHPFVAMPEIPRAEPVRRAGSTMKMFARQGVELLMSGHLHQSFARPWRYPSGSILTLGAPTALSNRLRGEPNGYWHITVDADQIRLRARRRIKDAFIDDGVMEFPRGSAAGRVRQTAEASDR